jgi:hypothetical protein
MNIFKTVKDELQGSAMSVFDDMMKRLLIAQHTPVFTMLINKVQTLKMKITNTYIEKGDVLMNWTAVRLLDDITLNIYNE